MDDAKSVHIRSWRAPELHISYRSGSKVTVYARPVLQATSMHGPEPDWRTKPAQAWPFGWEAKREGNRMILSSTGEQRLPHHRYLLEELTVTVPPGVQVRGERKPLEQTPE